MKKFAALAVTVIMSSIQISGADTACPETTCDGSKVVIDEVQMGAAGWYLAELRIPKGVTPGIEIAGRLDPSWRYQWASATLFDADGYMTGFPRIWQNSDSGIRLRTGSGFDVGLNPAPIEPDDGSVNGTQSVTAPRTGRFQLLVSVVADTPISDLTVRLTQSVAAATNQQIDLFGSWTGSDIMAIWPHEAALEASPGAALSATGSMSFDDRLFVQSGYSSTTATVIESPVGRWVRAGGFVLDGGPTGTYRFDSSRFDILEPLAIVGVDLPVPLPYF
ncbi:MAG: hypothetical protein ACLGH3_08595 [Actinomycetota bacterium]